MHDPKELWKEVEQLQELLHETVSKKGIDSPETNRVIHEFRNKMQEYNNLVSRCDNINKNKRRRRTNNAKSKETESKLSCLTAYDRALYRALFYFVFNNQPENKNRLNGRRGLLRLCRLPDNPAPAVRNLRKGMYHHYFLNIA